MRLADYSVHAVRSRKWQAGTTLAALSGGCILLLTLSGVAFAGLTGHLLLHDVDARMLPVKVSLSVVNEHGVPLRGLKAGDLRVSLNGEGISPGERASPNEGAFFGLSEATGMSAPESFVVLAFDVSRSVRNGLPLATQAAKSFVTGLGANDHVMVVSFGKQVRQECEFTRDKNRIIASISGLSATEGVTRLWDAIYESLNALASCPSKRRSLVVFSDGEDTNSTMQPRDCVVRAEHERVPIISGSLTESDVRAESLKQLSALSGGSNFKFENLAQPSQIASALMERLLPEYTLAVAHPSLARGGMFELAVGLAPASTGVVTTSDTIRLLASKRDDDASAWRPYLIPILLSLLVLVSGLLLVRHRSASKVPNEAPVRPEPAREEVRASTLRKQMRHLEELTQQLASGCQQLPKGLGGYEREIRRLEDTFVSLVKGLLEIRGTTQDMVNCIERNEADAEATQIHVLWNRDNLNALLRGNSHLSRMDVKKGDVYDVTQHEQIGMVPPSGDRPPDTIAEVVRDGWIIALPDFEVTIRPKVIVAKPKEAL